LKRPPSGGILDAGFCGIDEFEIEKQNGKLFVQRFVIK
jgi:hypothetical protein